MVESDTIRGAIAAYFESMSSADVDAVYAMLPLVTLGICLRLNTGNRALRRRCYWRIPSDACHWDCWRCRQRETRTASILQCDLLSLFAECDELSFTAELVGKFSSSRAAASLVTVEGYHAASPLHFEGDAHSEIHAVRLMAGVIGSSKTTVQFDNINMWKFTNGGKIVLLRVYSGGGVPFDEWV